MFVQCISIVLAVFFYPSGAVGAEKKESVLEVSLPEIIQEGSPIDFLNQDRILPSLEKSTTSSNGSGSIGHQLNQELSLPVTDTGTPGGLTQFRGLGRSAEDVNTQTLGIPLNSPVGGGFDFSSFPQFIWSHYRLQVGSALGAWDSRGVSGTLSLVPWTLGALDEPGQQNHVLCFYSSQNLLQISAATKPIENLAALAGYSAGKVKGPSGAFSARSQLNEDQALSFHLLATSLETEVPGSLSFPTPLARQKIWRMIPVILGDFRLGAKSFLKTSIFYDYSSLHYHDPGSGFVTHDRFQQGGVENAFSWKNWRLGLSGRKVGYQKLNFNPALENLTENLGSFYLSSHWQWDDLYIEPTLQAVSVSRFGLLPQGSLGLRKEIPFSQMISTQAIFTRLSFVRKVPSLVDRYYVIPGVFSGNPDLKTEPVWTWVFGHELQLEGFENIAQAYFQLRENAIISKKKEGVSSLDQNGSAWVMAWMNQSRFKITQAMDISHSLTLTESRVISLSQRFSYLPSVVDVASLRIYSPELEDWEGTFSVRLSDSSIHPHGGRVAGYGTIDLKGRKKIFPFLSAELFIENLLDRRYELIQDFLAEGRVIGVLLTGTL